MPFVIDNKETPSNFAAGDSVTFRQAWLHENDDAHVREPNLTGETVSYNVLSAGVSSMRFRDSHSVVLIPWIDIRDDTGFVVRRRSHLFSLSKK